MGEVAGHSELQGGDGDDNDSMMVGVLGGGDMEG